MTRGSAPVRVRGLRPWFRLGLPARHYQRSQDHDQGQQSPVKLFAWRKLLSELVHCKALLSQNAS